MATVIVAGPVGVSGSGTYNAGAVVTLSIEGVDTSTQAFVRWYIADGSEYVDWVEGSGSSLPTAQFIIRSSTASTVRIWVLAEFEQWDSKANAEDETLLGVITTEGSRKLTEFALSQTKRLGIWGAKIAYLNNPYLQLTSDRRAMDITTEQYESRISGSQSTQFIPVTSSVQTFPEAGDRVTLQLSVMLNNNNSFLPSAVNDKFNEVAFYGRVMLNSPPEWDATLKYRKGDIVQRPGAIYPVYRSLVDNNIGSNPSGSSAWMPLPYPASTLIEGVRWFPDPKEEPFLLYIVTKYDYPPCLSPAFTIRYAVNIEIAPSESAKAIFILPEDADHTSEIQLAYLDNMSQSLRAARDYQRISEVAINSMRGEWVSTVIYEWGDVVTFTDERATKRMWLQNYQIKDADRTTNLSNLIIALQNFKRGFWYPPSSPIASNNIPWVWLSPDIINKRDNWRPAAVYAKNQIVVWGGKFYYRSGASQVNTKEPGKTASSDSGWTEFQIGRKL